MDLVSGFSTSIYEPMSYFLQSLNYLLKVSWLYVMLWSLSQSQSGLLSRAHDMMAGSSQEAGSWSRVQNECFLEFA